MSDDSEISIYVEFIPFKNCYKKKNTIDSPSY